MRVASIDLGSNSFHMLIAEVLGPASFEVVLQEKMMIQLGKTTLVTGRLDPEAMERGLQCLDDFRRIAIARRVDRTIAVATSAIREAENGDEFLRRAREEVGLPVRVISGREEARLIHLAVSRQVDLQSGKALLIDIGGGSVELTVGDAAKIYYSNSVKMGFLRLHGRFVTTDPASKRELRVMTAFLRDALAGPMASVRKHAPGRVIGTSGSISTLQRVAQQRRSGPASSGSAADVSRAELRDILEELSSMPSVARARKFDLDPLRAEYLPTALICLDSILERGGFDTLSVCPVALREGVIYDYMTYAQPATALPGSPGDLQLQAVIDLASRSDYPVDHSHRVAALAGQIFSQTTPLHGLGDAEARMLRHAAILHDIGYHIGYSKHHKHAHYLVMNSDLRGFSPEEREVLANVVRYHRRALPKMSHKPFAALPSRARKTVKQLAAILRIADALDMSHFSLVDEIRCTIGKKRVRFQLITNQLYPNAELDLLQVKAHASYFESLFDVSTSFAIIKPQVSKRSGDAVKAHA